MRAWKAVVGMPGRRGTRRQETKGPGGQGDKQRTAMIGRLLAYGALLGLLVLAACGGPALPPLEADQQRFQQQIDGVTITLDSSKAPRVDQTETLRIMLHDAQGRPMNDAAVSVDLEMDMLCLSGMTPVGTPAGDGRYDIHSVYQMAGEWRITVLAETRSGPREAVFAVEVGE